MNCLFIVSTLLQNSLYFSCLFIRVLCKLQTSTTWMQYSLQILFPDIVDFYCYVVCYYFHEIVLDGIFSFFSLIPSGVSRFFLFVCFLFFFLLLFTAISRLGVKWQLQLLACTTATATWDPSLATAYGNTVSLTHWAEPGIEPESSWIQVGFISTEPRWELLGIPVLIKAISQALDCTCGLP